MEASLKRLRRESVDLIQLHTAVTQAQGAQPGSISLDNVLGDGGVVVGFERLREQGLVRFLGFSGFGETKPLHSLVTSGHFDAVQAYYNLLNPSAGRIVPTGFSAHDYRDLIGFAAANGVGVLNIRVLAAGAIVISEPPDAGEGISPGSSAAADFERTSLVREALGDEAGSMAQTAVRFGLTNPGVSGVLVGFSQVEHIDEAVAASDLGSLTPSVMRKLDALYESDFGAH